MTDTKEKREYFIVIIISIVLLLPAFLYKVTTLTLIPDEAIRALVALEMKLSGDYITPTMGGEFYYNKPPVYNWIVSLVYTITGKYNELGTRVPVLISLFGYAFSIFLVTKNRYGLKTGISAALLFFVSIWILIYESLFGLIDMAYAWILFLNFILIFKLFHQQKLLTLFLVSYALTGITILFKGLPSIAFQGITLLIIFISNKQFKKLFSWQHIVGSLPLFILIGSYYWAYYLKNPDQINQVLYTLVYESAEKSAIAYSTWDVIKHIFTYSFEIFYNFIPSTLFVFFLIKRKPFALFKADPFLKYIILVFVCNMSIFLISPRSFMRYALPFISLLIIVFTVHYYTEKKQTKSIQIKLLDTVFLFAPFAISIALIAFSIIPDLDFVENKWVKSISLTIILLGITVWLFKKKQYRLELLIISLLMARIGFNLFIIPSRTHGHWQIEMREQCYEVGEKLKDEKAYLYSGLVTTSHFYLTAGKQGVIPFETDTSLTGYHLYTDKKKDEISTTIFFEHKVAGSANPLIITKKE